METLKEIIKDTKLINDEILDQIIEIVDEVDKINYSDYITFNELKVFIKDYETFNTRDKIQDISSKIDILLNNYINSTVTEITTMTTETEDSEQNYISVSSYQH